MTGKKQFILSTALGLAAGARLLAGDFVFGVCTHHGDTDAYYSLARQAGVMANRDDFNWESCEPEKGVVKIPAFHGAYLDRCRAAGMDSICILDYGNKFYEKGNFPRAQESVAAYARYAEAMAAKLKGKVRFYQVWNEWDGGCGMGSRGDAESYLKLLAATYPKIKAADPGAIVIANSACSDDFLKRTLELGVLRHCDGLALHAYFFGDPRKTVENTWLPRMQALDATIRAANGGRPFPLYATEIGWPTHVAADGSTEALSADCMARTYLLALSLPFIKGVWWYDFRDDGWAHDYSENNFGMLRHDLTPKQSYFVFRDLTAFLKGAEFVGRVDVGDPQVWVMKYQKPDRRRVIAFWTENRDVDCQAVFSLPAGAPSAVNASLLGNGTIRRAFAKSGADAKRQTLSITTKGVRPWLIEGELDGVDVAAIAKHPFPESSRPGKVLIRAPAMIGKALNVGGAGPDIFYAFNEDADYRQATGTPRGGQQDLAARVSMRWSEDRLLMRVEVTDDTFCQPEKGANTWRGDGLQLGFLALGPDSGRESDHVDLDVALTADGPKVYRQEGTAKLKTGPVEKIKAEILREKGSGPVTYLLDIPVSEAGLPKLRQGTAVGLTLLVNDNDGKGRKGYLHWGDGLGVAKDPSQYNWVVME